MRKNIKDIFLKYLEKETLFFEVSETEEIRNKNWCSANLLELEFKNDHIPFSPFYNQAFLPAEKIEQAIFTKIKERFWKERKHFLDSELLRNLFVVEEDSDPMLNWLFQDWEEKIAEIQKRKTEPKSKNDEGHPGYLFTALKFFILHKLHQRKKIWKKPEKRERGIYADVEFSLFPIFELFRSSFPFHFWLIPEKIKAEQDLMNNFASAMQKNNALLLINFLWSEPFKKFLEKYLWKESSRSCDLSCLLKKTRKTRNRMEHATEIPKDMKNKIPQGGKIESYLSFKPEAWSGWISNWDSSRNNPVLECTLEITDKITKGAKNSDKIELRVFPFAIFLAFLDKFLDHLTP